MKVTLIDTNSNTFGTMVEAMGVCRGKECSLRSVVGALDAKPVPHLAVLEFGWACVKVEGVSIKTRIQLIRHRMFSTMERSTREIDMSKAEPVVPETAKQLLNFHLDYISATKRYAEAVEKYGETYEDASYLLPLGTETTFYLAGNLRVWYEYFQKRLCKNHVQDEHYRLAVELFKAIKAEFPMISKSIPCPSCGKCQGGA